MPNYIIYAGFAINPLELFDARLLEKYFKETQRLTRQEFAAEYQNHWQTFFEFWSNPQAWQKIQGDTTTLDLRYPDTYLINFSKPIKYYNGKTSHILQGPATAIMIEDPEQGDLKITSFSRQGAIEEIASYCFDVIGFVNNLSHQATLNYPNLKNYFTWLDDQDSQNDSNNLYFQHHYILIQLR